MIHDILDLIERIEAEVGNDVSGKVYIDKPSGDLQFRADWHSFDNHAIYTIPRLTTVRSKDQPESFLSLVANRVAASFKQAFIDLELEKKNQKP